MNLAKRLHAEVLLLVNNMGSCHRPHACQWKTEWYWEGAFPCFAFLAASVLYALLKQKMFSSQRLFYCPTMWPGCWERCRLVTHLYSSLPLWAQSSKEMHNSGRLMTWNGLYESILINWSTKDLPWKGSPPEMRQLLIYTLNTTRSRDIEWAVQRGVRWCRESLAPSNTPAPLGSLHVSFHPHFSLPHSPKPLPLLHALTTPGGTAPAGTSAQPTRMLQRAAVSPLYPVIARQSPTAPHLEVSLYFIKLVLIAGGGSAGCSCSVTVPLKLQEEAARAELWAGCSSSSHKPPRSPVAAQLKLSVCLLCLGFSWEKGH